MKERLKKYNIYTPEFVRMVREQHNCCKICNKPASGESLNIDHDHKDGSVRGLLCPQCNKGLGLFYDNVDYLQAAIDYLNNHKNKINSF